MSLTSIELKRFTAFSDLTLDFSPGINVLVGANGTGKTHIMKACYAACDITMTGTSFAEKLFRVFLPSGRIGRLVKRQAGRSKGSVSIRSGSRRVTASFSTLVRQPGSAAVSGADRWASQKIESVYIPVKDMLANAPGFVSLYARREIYFEEIYSDIIDRSSLPPLRGPMDQDRRRLTKILSDAIDGRVTIDNKGEFFLSNRQGNIEFTLLAEGMRKLALLWLLIRNGTLRSGSVLFWDEPETNLNPKTFRTLMDILMELQRSGVQIFLATHDYVILKELDLLRGEDDAIAYHALYRGDDGEIACNTVSDHTGIHPNAIADTFDDLYDREIQRVAT